MSFIVECERLIKEKCLNDRYHEYWWALRRSIGFYDPIIPWRVALQHFSLLLHRMQEFIISVSDGQPTYRHGHVHNLFKTVCCPTISVHPSLTSKVLEDIPEFDDNGIPNYIGEKTLTLTKYVYVKGYDEENLLVPDVKCTYPSKSLNDSWKTIKPNMEHPLWLLNMGDGTTNSFLNVSTYNDRDNAGYLEYKFANRFVFWGAVFLFLRATQR